MYSGGEGGVYSGGEGEWWVVQGRTPVTPPHTSLMNGLVAVQWSGGAEEVEQCRGGGAVQWSGAVVEVAPVHLARPWLITRPTPPLISDSSPAGHQAPSRTLLAPPSSS